VDQSQGPDYGPRGYLPPRAARRARKIVLRERMGLHWPLAALAACVLLVVVGLVYLLRSGPPGAPFLSLGPVEGLTADDGTTVVPSDVYRAFLVVTAGGRVRVFAAPAADVTYCEDTRALEGDGGQVWTPDGILVGGQGESLTPLASTVHRGQLYADPTAGTDLPEDPTGATPACTP
jgi:hypothetical protein